jgi:hypothetical protein
MDLKIVSGPIVFSKRRALFCGHDHTTRFELKIKVFVIET